MDQKFIEGFQQLSREHGPEIALAHNGQQVIWFKNGKREERPEPGSSVLIKFAQVGGGML